MSAYCHEYDCGCIVHSLAGTLRKCAGLTSRSLSGRMLPKGEGAEKRHNDAFSQEPSKVYEVAEILP